VASFDVFHDLRGASSPQIAQRIRDDQIDVLIDLKGFTVDCRPEVFAMRPAPVQLTWIGYPGTSGANWFDGVITDRVVTPPDQQVFYSEPFAYLPHCYQANDNKAPVSKKVTRREDWGLPAKGFVFCCFNSHHKLEPHVFGLWMQILREVSDSVLWLIEPAGSALERVKSAALATGVDPNRLVFAPIVDKAIHLERLRHADLFLDTYFYNAHTTASDALSQGVPVLTRPGVQFQSRVAASLINTLGLTDELVRNTSEEYVQRATELARDVKMRSALSKRIRKVVKTSPLYDSAGLARDLEKLFEETFDRRAFIRA